MASLPTLIIEAAPGYGPLSTVPGGAWVDLGPVNAATATGSSRQRETDRFSGGRISATLDATDGSNDPTNPAGDLEIGTPIRLRSAWGSITYPVAYGFVDEVAPRWTQLTSDFADIVATDAFAYLAGLKVFDSGYAALLASASPAAFWPLDDQPTIGHHVDATGNGHTLTRNSPSWDDAIYQPGAPPVLPLTVGGSTILKSTSIATSASFFRSLSSWTIEIAFRYLFDDPVGVGLITVADAALYTGATGTGNEALVSIIGSVGFGPSFPPGEMVISNGVSTLVTSGCNVIDGGVHTAHLCKRSGVVLELWVDGVLKQSLSSTALSSTVELLFGGYFTSGCAVSHAAVYTSALFSATIAAHAALAIHPWRGDTSGQRINRILDLLGWPASMRSIDAGKSIVSAPLDDAFVQNPLAALDYLQRIAEAEGGRLFVGPDGKIVFHDRRRPLLSPLVTAVTELTPVAYWRMGTTMPIVDVAGGHNLTAGGGGTFLQPGLVAADNDLAVRFSTSAGISDATVNPWSGDWSLFLLFTATAPTSFRSGLLAAEVFGASGFRLGIDTARVVRFWTTQSGGATDLAGAAVTMGVTHSLLVTRKGTTLRIYIDGVLYASTTSLSYVAPPAGILVGAYSGASDPLGGLVDEVAVWSSELDPWAAGALHVAAIDAVQATYSDVDYTHVQPARTFPYSTGGLKGSKSRAEVLNQAVVTRAPAPGDDDDPVTQVANDDASQAALKMVATITQSGQLNPTDRECFNKGRAITRQRSTPRFRAKEINLDGRATDTLWPEILGRQVGDLIEIRRHPPSGIAYTDELRVEGKTLVYSKRELVAKIVASAADTTDWMQIGDPLGGPMFW